MADNSDQGSLLGKIAAYTELLDKDRCSTIFVPLSEAYRQMGMLDDAVDIAKKGIMENPAFPSGYAVYGRVLAQQGLTDEAVAEFEKALILDRKHFAALKALAKIRIQQDNRGEARKLLEQAHRITPDDVAVVEMLAVLKKESVEPSAPETAAGPSAPAQPANKATEPISTATIADIYIRQGFLVKALKVYRDLLRVDPHNDQLRQKLIALKERLAGEGAEEGGVLIGDSEVASLESSPLDAAPAAVIAETVMTEPDSLAEPACRSIVEIFAGWLDSVSRRREAHVS